MSDTKQLLRSQNLSVTSVRVVLLQVLEGMATFECAGNFYCRTEQTANSNFASRL